MVASRLFPAGAALGLVGVVLVVVETARALSGSTLGTLSTVLLWLGVGLVAAGGLLLLLVVLNAEPEPRPDGAVMSDGGQPTDG